MDASYRAAMSGNAESTVAALIARKKSYASL